MRASLTVEESRVLALREVEKLALRTREDIHITCLIIFDSANYY